MTTLVNDVEVATIKSVDLAHRSGMDACVQLVRRITERKFMVRVRTWDAHGEPMRSEDTIWCGRSVAYEGFAMMLDNLEAMGFEADGWA